MKSGWLSTAGFLPEYERAEAAKHPLYCRVPTVLSISTIWRTLRAFAVSPFEDGAVMIVDGVGSYHLTSWNPIHQLIPPHTRPRVRELLNSAVQDQCLKKYGWSPTVAS